MTKKQHILEVILAEIEGSPFRQMECQIENGIKNARKNWKRKKISDDDFKRIVSNMWIPIKDVRGLILHFGAFEQGYKTDLERANIRNKELMDLIEAQGRQITRLEALLENSPNIDKVVKNE